jgi:hypothetical protein
MDWKSLKSDDIRRFIARHEAEDTGALALRRSPDPAWDYPLVLRQISARQKARKKIPAWFENDAPVIFPPAEIVEQASSQATALYKASLVQGERFVDLSGGMGVDSWALARRFAKGTVVEQDPLAADLLAHNFAALGLAHLSVTRARAEDYVPAMGQADLVYIDPQRRAGGHKGRFFLEGGTPDVPALLPALREKASLLMLKTSPMLDLSEGMKTLGGVQEIHIVEKDSDCKEVLYLCDFERRDPADVPIRAVILDRDGRAEKSFTHTPRQEQDAQAPYALPLAYVYEPGPAAQKSGGFKTLALEYGLKKLHPSTHLYTGPDPCPEFPGRGFAVHGLYKPHAGDLPVKRANLTLRNFPGSTEALRKQLKLADGGEDTLLACTLMDERRMMIHGRKL